MSARVFTDSEFQLLRALSRDRNTSSAVQVVSAGQRRYMCSGVVLPYAPRTYHTLTARGCLVQQGKRFTLTDKGRQRLAEEEKRRGAWNVSVLDDDAQMRTEFEEERRRDHDQ